MSAGESDIFALTLGFKLSIWGRQNEGEFELAARGKCALATQQNYRKYARELKSAILGMFADKFLKIQEVLGRDE